MSPTRYRSSQIGSSSGICGRVLSVSEDARVRPQLYVLRQGSREQPIGKCAMPSGRESQYADFQARLERVAIEVNLHFPEALPLSEIRAIARSVSKWTWRHFSAEKFSAHPIVPFLASAKRWAGHVSA